MSRFRIPPRIAPSPAAEEPGQQNAVARLRSSREAQTRLLAERRGIVPENAGAPDWSDAIPTDDLADRSRISGKREGDTDGSRLTQPIAGTSRKVAKVKLVVLYRLQLDLKPDVAVIAKRDSVTIDYVMRALAREGREKLRALSGDADVKVITAEASAFRSLIGGVMVVGDPMTVYVQSDALEAMHRALDDPWCALPRATVVGAYFSVIVARLVKARRRGRDLEDENQS